MLSLTPADLTDARTLLGPHARFLARGATCAVYTDGHWVTRLALTPEAQLGVQSGLQQALAQAGGRVAAVQRAGVLVESGGEGSAGRAYIVEQLLRSDDSDPTAAGWAEVGQTLRLLHDLPCTGYGLLLDQPAPLTGRAITPELGLLSRLHRAWPFDGLPLSAQPLVQSAPDLEAALHSLEPELRRVVHLPPVVCHTDLHANQFVWWQGRLAGLLDFGDATVAPAVWDSASLAYFHGWTVLDQTGLLATEGADSLDVALFGLLLAMHRADRAQAGAQAGRLARAVAFARECLEHLQ